MESFFFHRFTVYNLLIVNFFANYSEAYGVSDLTDSIIVKDEKPINTNIKFKDYAPGQTLLLSPSQDEMIEINHPVRIVNQVMSQ